MRRLDVFHELGKSPDSGPSRMLVTSSNGYGLTTGSYKADKLTLAPLGRRLAIDGDQKALIDAVLNVDVFKKFFERYRNSALPSGIAALSFLAEEGISTDRTKACWEMILANGRTTGLIESVSGAERILSPEHAVERKFGKEAPAAKTNGAKPEDQAAGATEVPPPIDIRQPSLHIDIQIHIDSSATSEQIDQIFASMARHLYPHQA